MNYVYHIAGYFSGHKLSLITILSVLIFAFSFGEASTGFALWEKLLKQVLHFGKGAKHKTSSK